MSEYHLNHPGVRARLDLLSQSQDEMRDRLAEILCWQPSTEDGQEWARENIYEWARMVQIFASLSGLLPNERTREQANHLTISHSNILAVGLAPDGRVVDGVAFRAALAREFGPGIGDAMLARLGGSLPAPETGDEDAFEAEFDIPPASAHEDPAVSD